MRVLLHGVGLVARLRGVAAAGVVGPTLTPVVATPCAAELTALSSPPLVVVHVTECPKLVAVIGGVPMLLVEVVVRDVILFPFTVHLLRALPVWLCVQENGGLAL